ncbi:type II toxin-antitoxin system Phd/YefM family antitoxin [Argonema antarcticum]|uniref:type II toxin-antitoxin system Phd/YefM family antitoxin n=1 Tax=Argonema antarcticum TaxID=2942763 RepID=UPI00201318F0|nr:type II toxin-antitoxin system Phd/YefM family antitoxin [Argonema antarcticum]MCL1472322.1 type II toxin-antitoxin system Phd/YefM family antitoxin [Argonema antarcticum A004/B2]
MRSYTLTEARNQHGEVFDQAIVEPVLLTKQSRPSHVIMSFDIYRHLMERLTELEDMALGKAAEAALSQSQMVGTESFVESLKQLANGET